MLIAILLITITLIFVLLSYLLYRIIDRYFDLNVRMGLYADVPYSMSRDRIHLNFINVNRHPEFWEVHESQFRLEAMGVIIEGVKFFRAPDIPTGLKISYPKKLDHKTVLALTAGVKYNNFRVSNDGGETFTWVNSIKDVVAKKYQMRESNLTKESTDQILKTDLRVSIMNSPKFKYLKDELGFDILNELKTFSLVNERKSTSTSLRHQTIISKDNPNYENIISNLENLKFYYIYNGDAYQFETELITHMDDYIEWDLVNLEPGKIYTGFSYSIDDGKTIVPSTALAGITRNEDNKVVPFDEAVLAQPKPGSTKYPAYTFDKAVEVLGEEMATAKFNMLVKKHYEAQNEEVYVPLKLAKDYYNNYSWVVGK